MLNLQPQSDDITSDETSIDILCVPQVAVKISNRAKPAEEDAIRSEIGFLAKSRLQANITALYGAFCDLHHSKGGRMTWYIVMLLCSSGDLFDYVPHKVLDSEDVVTSWRVCHQH